MFDVDEAMRLMDIYGEVKVKIVERLTCPFCNAKVRDKDKNWTIPTCYIGEDPVGFQCYCGKVLSWSLMTRYEALKPDVEGEK